MSWPYPHWRLILVTIFHGLAGYSVFFYMPLLSPIELRVKDLANHSINAHYGFEQSEESLEWVWAIISSSRLIGALIGAATIKYPAEKFGRRNTVMVLKNMILISSGIFQFLSRPLNSIELLVLGRILDGVAFSQTLLIAVFLAESCPTEFRGLVSSAPSLGGRIWALCGALFPLLNVFNTESSWNYLFLCPTVAAVIHLFATPLIPKSVKHLYITKEEKKLSRKASHFYHGPNVKTEELQEDMNKEAEISPTLKIANIKVLLAAKQFRQPLLICVITILMMPMGGDHIVNQYSTGLLRTFGIAPSDAPLYNALLVQLPIFVISLIGVSSLEKFGRRRILLSGVAFSALGTGILVLATPSKMLSDSLPPIVSIIGLVMVVVGLTGGANLIGPVLPGELAPQASRSLTFAVSRFTGTIVLFGLSLSFPTLMQLVGSYCILPLPICGMLGFAFLYKRLPESKGKTVYEIVQPWMSKRKTAKGRKGMKWTGRLSVIHEMELTDVQNTQNGMQSENTTNEVCEEAGSFKQTNVN